MPYRHWIFLALGLCLVIGSQPVVQPAAAIGSLATSGTSGWQEDQVFKASDPYSGLDMVIDSLGGRHVLLLDRATGVLKYAYSERGGSDWSVITVAEGGFTEVALTLASDGSPKVAFTRFPDLFYATRRPNGTFQVQTVSHGLAIGGLSLGWSETGPQIVFGVERNRVNYAHNDILGWVVDTIPLPDVISQYGVPDLAIDYGNHLHIAISRGGNVYYVNNVGGTWQTQNLGPGGHPAIAIEDYSTSRVHIVFRLGLEIRHTLRDGIAWVSDTVDTVAADTPDMFKPGLDLDASGHPYVAFASGSDLRVRRMLAGVWADASADPIDHAVFGRQLILRVDNQNLPHVAFRSTWGEIYHGVLDGAWWLDTLENGVSLGGTSIAVPRNGVGRISYAALTGPDRGLRFAVPSVNCAPPSCFSTWAKSTVAAGATGERGLDNSIALRSAVDGGDARIASYNPVSHVLEYTYQSGLVWETETVDSSGDVGRYASLALDDGGVPHIAYWDATHHQIKLAWKTASGWQTTTNTAGPALDAASGALSMALTPSTSPYCCSVNISYYDAVNKNLRLAVYKDLVWHDYLIESTGDVGRLNSLAYWQDFVYGFIVVYSDDTNGSLNVAQGLDGSWYDQPGLSSVGTVTDLSPIWADYYADERRFAYSTTGGALLVAAQSAGSGWSTTTVESGGGATLDHLGLSVGGGRVHLTYTRNSTVMVHAVSLATNADLYYNPLQPCLNNPNLPASFGDWAADFVVPAPTAVLDDLDTLRTLRDLFATTPDGQHFIDLYYTYAAETGAMALNDPALALEAYGVMQSLLPGFEALVRGHGDDVHVTADMIAQANALLDELTGAGSPQLAAALATERARFNQLADFEGLTFAQASALLGVTPPGLVYLTELSR